MDQFDQTQEPIKPSQRPDCESRDHPDPLVNDCEDLLRPEVSQEVYEVYKETINPTQEPEVNWTSVETPLEDTTEHEFEQRAPEFAAQTDPEASTYDEDWADKSLDEIKAGLKQISGALKSAFEQGKEDPRFKKFGDDVKDSFNKISDEISDFFKRS